MSDFFLVVLKHYIFSILPSFDIRYQRALDWRTKFEVYLKVFARVLKKKTPRKASFCFFFSPKKLVQLFIPKEVQPYPDSKMIKLLTFDNLFLPLRHSQNDHLA